jgi:hypothetical protein
MNNARRNSIITAMVGITLITVAPLARSQTAQVGDLVEFTSGLGPTLAEIVVGPDASGYVVIRIPTGKQIPVNTQKLRLVQKAGTPNASIPVGAAVSWIDAHIVERGSVVKVNGNWCQVKTPSATTIGWVECKDLRTGKNDATTAPAAPAESAAPKATAAAAAAISGTYQNAEGNTSIEFLPAGKAHLSLHGMGGPATYKVAGNKLTLMVDDDAAIEFTINPDNSLTGPPDGYLSRLKKKKE